MALVPVEVAVVVKAVMVERVVVVDGGGDGGGAGCIDGGDGAGDGGGDGGGGGPDTVVMVIWK